MIRAPGNAACIRPRNRKFVGLRGALPFQGQRAEIVVCLRKLRIGTECPPVARGRILEPPEAPVGISEVEVRGWIVGGTLHRQT